MALLEQWRSMAYSETANKGDLKRLWQKYFLKEKEIYAQLLEDPDTEVKGTVKELAEKYNVDIMTMTGFLDGINDSFSPLDNRCLARFCCEYVVLSGFSAISIAASFTSS